MWVGLKFYKLLIKLWETLKTHKKVKIHEGKVFERWLLEIHIKSPKILIYDLEKSTLVKIKLK